MVIGILHRLYCFDLHVEQLVFFFWVLRFSEYFTPCFWDSIKGYNFKEKTAWKKFRELLPILSPATPLTRTVAMYTAPACRGPSSMPVKLGHWPRPTCSATIGSWPDQARGCGHCKVKRATCKAWAWGPQPHFEREKASLVWACGTFYWCS